MRTSTRKPVQNVRTVVPTRSGIRTAGDSGLGLRERVHVLGTVRSESVPGYRSTPESNHVKKVARTFELAELLIPVTNRLGGAGFTRGQYDIAVVKPCSLRATYLYYTTGPRNTTFDRLYYRFSVVGSPFLHVIWRFYPCRSLPWATRYWPNSKRGDYPGSCGEGIK